MITQEDIEAFEEYQAPGNTSERQKIKATKAFQKILQQSNNLAYEFHADHMYDLLLFTAHFGTLLNNEELMKIAYEAQLIWNKEHN